MWTSTLYLDPGKIMLTRLVGFFYPDIYYSSLAPLRVENLPRRQLPASTWVRVRNRLAGIGGSDLHLVRANGDLRIAPAALPGLRQSYPGHEIVGEVIEIGDDVQNLQIGDRVVLQHGPNCLAAEMREPCAACINGNYNLCEQGILPQPQQIGGGWSEEMLISEHQLFVVPDEMSDEQAVMLEPAAVALHAVLRRPPQPGEHILIIGAGTIGLLTLQIVRTLAPQATISVLARHSFQVEQATRMGATHIIYPHDSYRDIQRITQARLFKGLLGNRNLLGGFDAIYDTIGQRQTLHHALRWTRAQGTIVLVGTDLHYMKHLDLSPLWHREINLLGSTSHGNEIWPLGSSLRRSTFDIAVDMMQQKDITPEQLITHHFALSNYREALTIAHGKNRSRAIKVVFDYALQPATAVPNLRASAQRWSDTPHNTGIPPVTVSEQFPASYPEEEKDLTGISAPTEQKQIGANEASSPWQYTEEDQDDDQVTETMLPVIRAQKRASTGEIPQAEKTSLQAHEAVTIVDTAVPPVHVPDTSMAEASKLPTLRFKHPETEATPQSEEPPAIPTTETSAALTILPPVIPATEPPVSETKEKPQEQNEQTNTQKEEPSQTIVADQTSAVQGTPLVLKVPGETAINHLETTPVTSIQAPEDTQSEKQTKIDDEQSNAVTIMSEAAVISEDDNAAISEKPSIQSSTDADILNQEQKMASIDSSGEEKKAGEALDKEVQKVDKKSAITASSQEIAVETGTKKHAENKQENTTPEIEKVKDKTASTYNQVNEADVPAEEKETGKAKNDDQTNSEAVAFTDPVVPDQVKKEKSATNSQTTASTDIDEAPTAVVQTRPRIRRKKRK